MARIAVGGFHHETNSFSAERTDFAYFASHPDRPLREAIALGSATAPKSGCANSGASLACLDAAGKPSAPPLWVVAARE